MKLESVTDVYLILAVLVPGFIYNGVLSNFVPLRQSSDKALIVLRLLTATSFNYALCSPLIYFLVTGSVLRSFPLGQAAVWLSILFIAPAALGLVRAWMVQRTDDLWPFSFLRLRPISSVPTGWDWVFGRTGPCYLLVTLKDGSEVAGFFGKRSMASSDPDRRDLYIEKVYRVPPDNGTWIEVEGSLGIHVEGSQISLIEFKR